MSVRLSRRDFCKVGATAGGGLIVGFSVPIESSARIVAPTEPPVLNAYVQIDPDGTVILTAPCPEIGQGVRTSLPMILAEELDVDWGMVHVVQASADAAYGGMTVGGSDSVVDYWEPLRLAGATARAMLVGAAAAEWGVRTSACFAERGVVIHRPTGRSLPFGQLAGRAATRPVPTDIRLKDTSEFGIIGTAISRTDIPEIARGTAQYGLDVRVPGMLYAVVSRCPVHGGSLKRFDAIRARAVPGVRDVVVLEPAAIGGLLYGAVRSGVAVVAESTWAALQGRRVLEVDWDHGSNAEESSALIRERFAARLKDPDAMRLRDEGDTAQAIAAAPTRVEAEYELPPLAHACMEPMNFTVDARPDSCDAWGPTQNPRLLKAVIAAAVKLPSDVVRLHPTLSGGGFGRRLAFEYGVETALLSRAVNAPVQLVWTREDDVQHDYYRAPSLHALRAGLDSDGRLVGWHHRIASASLLRNIEQSPSEHPALYDVQGAADMPYQVANLLIEYAPADVGLQMGSWRSVSHSSNVFVVNSFVDEVAAMARRDPLDYQLELLGESRQIEIRLPLPGRRGRVQCDTGLLRHVLEVAAEQAGWGTPVPAGRGRGIACTYYKQTYAAHVAEVSVTKDGSVRVSRIVAAVDCGVAIDPNGIEAQVEGAAMDGVSTVFKWGITLDRGRVQQANFVDYPLLRMDEAPVIDTHIVPSNRPPSGMGEPPYPSVAPAITNAIFAATGKRIRRLPIREGDL